MSVEISDTTKDPKQDEFPEMTIEVSPIVERSRATFAKTHNRPMMTEFTRLFEANEDVKK